MLKIIFLSDIVGKIGRKAVIKYLPQLKKKYNPDLIIANAENLAHGVGFTEKTLTEMEKAGVDVFTSGNHAWKKGQSDEILNNKKFNIIRPANYNFRKSGRGVVSIKSGSKKIIVVNLMGDVFIKDKVSSPFNKMQSILGKLNKKDIVLVDFHAEATSEKTAFANYFSNRISAVFGTHTHVPTCDQRIIDDKCAFVTDVGMIGYYDSVIGSDKHQVYNIFLGTGSSSKKHDMPSSGKCQFNALYVEIDTRTGRAINIKRLDKVLTIK